MPVSKQTTADTVRVAASAGTTFATSAAAVGLLGTGAAGVASAAGVGATAAGVSTAVAGELTAAGVSAAVPIAGWIVAGALTLAAGLTAAIPALVNAGKRRKEAVQIATQLGLPDPEAAPTFLVSALQWNAQERAKQLGKLAAKLQRWAKHPTSKTFAKIVTEMRILIALNLIEARQVASAPLPSPQAVAQAAKQAGTTSYPRPYSNIDNNANPAIIAGIAIGLIAALGLLGYAALGGAR